MENLSEIWTKNSSHVIKQSITKTKELGICDDETVKKIIIEDLCCNFDSVCEQLRKLKKDMAIKDFDLRIAKEDMARLEKRIKILEAENKRR